MLLAYRQCGKLLLGMEEIQESLGNLLLKSMQRCIEHFRSLEDSDRSQAACVKFLQDRLVYFYPNNPHIVHRMQALAAELGGTLYAPPLRRKYRWIRSAFGWPAAKGAARACQGSKAFVERTWDQLMYSFTASRG